MSPPSISPSEGPIRAVARRGAAAGYAHEVEAGGHRLTVDEPRENGGTDTGPTPLHALAASLASCTAITVEMYADRKGWQIGPIEVAAEFTLSERGQPTRFRLDLRLPDHLEPDQVNRLRAIAARCPVHRVLQSETVFVECVELAASPRA